MEYFRFSVFLVSPDSTIKSEIKRTHPYVIISPNEMNRNISTIIIAPLTSRLRNYPTRVSCKVAEKRGQIVLDQIITVDQSRLLKKIDVIDERVQKKIFSVLNEMFSE